MIRYTSETSSSEENYPNNPLISTPNNLKQAHLEDLQMSSSPEETTYTKKIQSIWDNIQKTRNLVSSEETDRLQSQTQFKSHRKNKLKKHCGEFSMQKNIDLLNSKHKSQSKSKHLEYQGLFMKTRGQSLWPDQANNQNYSFTDNKQTGSDSLTPSSDIKSSEKNEFRVFKKTSHSKKPKAESIGQQHSRAEDRSLKNGSQSMLITGEHNLSEIICQLQQQLAQSKENVNVLMKKLIVAEDRAENASKELNEQNYVQFELEKKITEMQRAQQKSMKDKQNQSGNQNYINQTQKQMREVEIKVDRLQLKIHSLQSQIQVKNTKIDALERENKLLYKTHMENSGSQAETFSNYKVEIKNSKGSQLLELDEAYKTIERLTALIKSTSEYKSLGFLAEELKGIHFLSNIPKRYKQNGLNICSKKSRKQQSRPSSGKGNSVCSACKEVKINEKLLWSPILSYKKMLEMKIKYDCLSEDCIEEVLFEMNRLYLSKEESRVLKLKTHYEAEISKLKKKNQQGYDEVLAKKQIERLKKELAASTVKKHQSRRGSVPKNRGIASVSYGQASNQHSEVEKLRLVGEYEDQLKLKQKEVRLLEERVRMFEGEANCYDKNLYYEGIVWIVDKVLEELDSASRDMASFENGFRVKISQAHSAEDWLMSYKEFFEVIEERNNSLVDKILSIKQGTIRKMENLEQA